MPDNKEPIVDNEDDIKLLDSVLPDDYEDEDEGKGNKEVDNVDDVDEDKEESDEKEEEVLDTSPLKTTYAAVKEKYPNLFKEFPELKQPFFKGQEYEKLFPTIEDAKESLEDVDAFVSLRESALEGNPELILEAVHSTDKTSFERFSLNFLDALHKKDPNVYGDVVAKPIQNVLRYAFEQGTTLIGRGKKEEGEAYQEAAKLIADIIFGDAGAADGSKNFVKSAPKPTETNEQVSAAFNGAVSAVNETITRDMQTAIRKGLDPNGAMTPFLRKTVIKDVMMQVAEELSHDTAWMNSQKSRWARAKREGYDTDSKRKITNAYLARAKDLIPTVRRKVVAEAMGVRAAHSERKVKQIERVTPKGKELLNGRVSQQERNGRVDSTRAIDYSKTSDEDILNGNIKYRS
jgi:hypothetical protein